MTTVSRLAAPRQCLWLSHQVLDVRTSEEDREAWYQASVTPSRPKSRVQELEHGWGLTHQQWAGDNSREPLRDETFPGWWEHEAIRARRDIATTSPKARWALASSFADLLDPGLIDLDLEHAIDQWQRAHMSENIKYRVDARRRREQARSGITAQLPGTGIQRPLEPGESSEILRAVLEQWAPLRLNDPDVLAISQPGDKVPDRSLIGRLGITLDEGNLLPDVIIVDIGKKSTDRPLFWLIEIVATHGAITDRRKQQLTEWATDQRIPLDRCRFLTAFASRSSTPARRLLKDLAPGTYAWFADEPDRELSWHEIASD